jgi:hypothetical protein
LCTREAHAAQPWEDLLGTCSRKDHHDGCGAAWLPGVTSPEVSREGESGEREPHSSVLTSRTRA